MVRKSWNTLQIIHFKRFVYVDAERRWMKSSKVVDFPLWDLDLSQWVLDQDAFDSAKYNCFAIAVRPFLSLFLDFLASISRDLWSIRNIGLI